MAWVVGRKPERRKVEKSGTMRQRGIWKEEWAQSSLKTLVLRVNVHWRLSTPEQEQINKVDKMTWARDIIHPASSP